MAAQEVDLNDPNANQESQDTESSEESTPSESGLKQKIIAFLASALQPIRPRKPVRLRRC